MSRLLAVCYLVRINEPQMKLILPHNEKVYVGLTLPPDPHPKQHAHIIVTADYNKKNVSVKNISKRATRFKETQLGLGEEVVMEDGDCITLQNEEVTYKVEFQPGYRPEHLDLTEESDNSNRVAKKKKKPNPIGIPKRLKGDWHVRQEVLIYTPPQMKSKRKIAGFSLIGTLVNIRQKTTSSRWDFAFKSVPKKLKRLHRDGYQIVVLTHNVLTENLDIVKFKRKFSRFIRRINVPMQVFMSLRGQPTKNPMPGLWSVFKERQLESINHRMSFFVGNQAGRVHYWAEDIPCSSFNMDQQFAANASIRFITSEEFFL